MTQPRFTEPQIAERRPLWVALSDLFLDTDVRLSYPYIARTMADAPFDFAMQHSILVNEVQPAVEHNLCDIAGEWAGFPEDWLIAEILRRAHSGAQTDVDLSSHWRCLLGLAGLLRALPDREARLRRTQAWHPLIPLFLDKTWRWGRQSVPEGVTIADLERFFRQDLEPHLREKAAHYASQWPDRYPNHDEIEANWRAFVTTQARS